MDVFITRNCIIILYSFMKLFILIIIIVVVDNVYMIGCSFPLPKQTIRASIEMNKQITHIRALFFRLSTHVHSKHYSAKMSSVIKHLPSSEQSNNIKTNNTTQSLYSTIHILVTIVPPNYNYTLPHKQVLE